MAVGQAQRRVVPLEQHVALQALGEVAGFHEALVAVAAGAFKTVELLGVGCHDDALGQLLKPGAVVGEDVDGVGIAYQRALGAPQLGDDGDGGLLAGAQSGTYAHGVEVLGVDSLGEGGLLTVELQYRLGYADLQDEMIALGGVGGDTPCSHA